MDTLPFGRLHQTGDDAVGLDSFLGSGSEADFSEDDHFAQWLLGVIVCWRYAGDAEEGEEVFLLRADEATVGVGRP